jgi:hypothetical protein
MRRTLRGFLEVDPLETGRVRERDLHSIIPLGLPGNHTDHDLLDNLSRRAVKIDETNAGRVREHY